MGLDVGLADHVVINEEPLGSGRVICMLLTHQLGLHGASYSDYISCDGQSQMRRHMNTKPVAKVYFKPSHKLNK